MAPGTWPFVRLGIQVDEDRPESSILIGSMYLGAQSKGVFDELSCVEKRVKAAVFVQRVSNAFVAAHPIAPDRAPIGDAAGIFGHLKPKRG